MEPARIMNPHGLFDPLGNDAFLEDNLMNRKWVISLIGMGTFTLILSATAMAILWQGPFHFFGGNKPDLNIYIQSPPLAELGEDVRMTLMVENFSEEYEMIDEIRLPALLTDSAVVNDVFPSLTPGRQEFYGDKTGYFIGMMVEPGERKEFFITLMPWQIADVAGQIEVMTSGKVREVGFRILFNKHPEIVLVATETETSYTHADVQAYIGADDHANNCAPGSAVPVSCQDLCKI